MEFFSIARTLNFFSPFHHFTRILVISSVQYFSHLQHLSLSLIHSQRQQELFFPSRGVYFSSIIIVIFTKKSVCSEFQFHSSFMDDGVRSWHQSQPAIDSSVVVSSRKRRVRVSLSTWNESDESMKVRKGALAVEWKKYSNSKYKYQSY